MNNDIIMALAITIDIMIPVCFIWGIYDGYKKRRGVWWLVDRIDDIAKKDNTINHFHISSQNVQVNADGKSIKTK